MTLISSCRSDLTRITGAKAPTTPNLTGQGFLRSSVTLTLPKADSTRFAHLSCRYKSSALRTSPFIKGRMRDFAAKRRYQGANVIHFGLVAQAVGVLIFTTS